MEKPSSRADADGGGGFVSSTVRFFFFLTHAGVLPRLGRTDDVDARVDGAIDSGDDRLTPSPKMPHPHGFARSLFGDATVWRSATRETRGAFIVALRRVVRAPTHTMSAISMSTVHVAGAVASARAPRRRAARSRRRPRARRRGRWVSWAARRLAGGSRCARRAAGPRAAPAASRSSRRPSARCASRPRAPLPRAARGASRRAERGARRPVPARARFRGAPKPQPCKPRDSRRRARVGPRSRDASTARPRAPATPPAPSPRDARPSPPPARVPLEPRDDDRIRRARDTRTGFFRAPRTASRFIHTTLASIFFRPDAAP